MKNNRIFLLGLLALAACQMFGQIDISVARNMAEGQVVTIEGIVTNGSELGIIRYVQDETGGIAVYPGTGSVGSFPDEVQRADRIRVRGELKVFNGLLEIDPIMEYTLLSSGNNLPDALLLDANGINEENEAKLLQVENVVFDDGGSVFGVGNYGFSADGIESEIYVRSNHPLLGLEIPLAKVRLRGIVSQFNSIYQLLPRDINDIEVVDNFFLTSSPKQTDINHSGFKVNWTTNVDANSIVRYGTSMSLGEEMVVSALTSDHSVELANLESGEFYYVQVASSNGNTEVVSPIRYFATASQSSGEMRVYFNHEVDGNFSNGSYPSSNTSAEVEAVLINFIDNAEVSIDISMYNSNRVQLIQALSAAHDRGVRVRFVADNGTANLALSNPSPDFTVIRGNSDGLMHNKFLIIDAESTNESWLISGSMNFTEQNLARDFNNMLAIQDEALCKAYTIEFEEMWGSSGDDPGIFNLKFGADKIDNTPHSFVSNGILVESYFSPSDNTTAAIARVLETADSELNFALLTFTNNTLGTSVLDAHNRGVAVRGIIDNVNDTGTEYDFLLDRGVPVTPDFTSISTHHKYCIVDAENSNSDPVVITGSHNWSASAETRNDENTLIIHDANIANIYLQEFEARWCESQGSAPCVTAVEELVLESDYEFNLFPNPINDYFEVQLETLENTAIQFEVYSIEGQLKMAHVVRNQLGQLNHRIETNSLSPGSYILLVRFDDKLLAKKIIRQ